MPIGWNTIIVLLFFNHKISELVVECLLRVFLPETQNKNLLEEGNCILRVSDIS